MENIKVADIQQGPSGAGYGQENINLGTAPAQAMMGLGQAMTISSETFDAFHDKKQRQINKKAEVELGMSVMEANAEINAFELANQHQPELIPEFAQKRMGKVWDTVDRRLVDDEANEYLEMEFEHQSKRTGIQVISKVNQLQIRNANAKIKQGAEFMIENGNIEGAVNLLDEVSEPEANKIAWLQNKIQGNVYSSVGMRMDSMNTPEELEEFSKEIMEKDAKGIYKDYVSEIELPSDVDSLVKIAGLKNNQRTHFARLAKQKADQIKGKQLGNWSNLVKRAGKGDPDVLIEVEESIIRNDAAAIPQEYKETAIKVLEDSIKEYEGEQKLEILEKAAKKEKKYKEVRDSLAGYYFNTEEFELGKELKKIEKLKVDAQIKRQLQVQAFDLAASQTSEMQPQEATDKGSLLFPLLYAYKAITGEDQVTQNEIDTLQGTYQTFKEVTEKVGNWEGLNDDVTAIQKEIKKFYKKFPDATPQQIEEMENRLFEPYDMKLIEWEMENQ